jgi:hypothetical protein
MTEKHMAKSQHYRGRRNATGQILPRRAICVGLILMQLGCRSVYRFHCTSNPTPVGVTIAEEMVGMTACDVQVPKDSPWIQDGKIEFTFHLPDEQVTPGRSRQKKYVVDLAGLKPSNPVAEVVSSPLFLAGVGLLSVAGEALKDKKHDSEEKKNVAKDLGVGAVGVVVLATGSGVHQLLGGDARSLSACEVRADFDEPSADSAQP